MQVVVNTKVRNVRCGGGIHDMNPHVFILHGGYLWDYPGTAAVFSILYIHECILCCRVGFLPDPNLYNKF